MMFDYGSPAELFTGRRKSHLRQRLRYRRFSTVAEAIRFVMEDLPAMRALGTLMLVGDSRFDSEEIHRLYESDGCNAERSNGQIVQPTE